MEILLVDDSRGDARLVKEALREEAPLDTLHHVIDGVEAMAFLHRNGAYADKPRPDIVLLDLNMPKMDGREVLRAIKSDPSLKTIPVVTLTTSTQREDVDYCYSTGVNAFISKPVNLDDFIHTVRQFKQFWLSVATLPHPHAA
ncbi:MULTISPECIES: response regulator [Magnetospirillum]|nr:MULTISPECIES: response regulator [Magnetospirillum]CAA7614320.1 Response regulator rcp1 [Magnetospirillum sp. LM-5]